MPKLQVRIVLLFLVNILLVVVATFTAFVLRDNLEFHADNLPDILPYLLITTCVAGCVFLASGAWRAVWRFSAAPDYFKMLTASATIVSLTVILSFSVNRMSGVARAIPILQTLLMSTALIGSRVLYRLYRAHRAEKITIAHIQPPQGEPVLIVGVNRVTELYLTCVRTYASKRINVVGLISEAKQSAVGRTAYGVPVHGLVNELPEVLRKLEVHGINIKRLVVTASFDHLDANAKEIIFELERSSGIIIDFMAERFAFTIRGLATEFSVGDAGPASNVIEGSDKFQGEIVSNQAKRQMLKRGIDAMCAAILLVVFSPLIMCVGVLVALEVGTPVLFWQYRPGLNNRPFKLLKFRTMAAAHDRLGNRLPDSKRLSPIGALLRRLRLDELPQLLNVLKGDMSFVGPRPLLEIDQQSAPEERLSVRPGLTGWAQINGGRLITDNDKIALDLWYIRHGSLILDWKIVLRTIPMIIYGDRTNRGAIEAAWDDLALSPSFRCSQQASVQNFESLKSAKYNVSDGLTT